MKKAQNRDRKISDLNEHQRINLSVALFNAKIIDPGAVFLYIWLRAVHSVGGEFEKINLRDYAHLTGLSLAKVSTGVRQLELNGLIEVKRGNGLLVSVNAIPDKFENVFINNLATVETKQNLNQANAKIKQEFKKEGIL